MSTAISIEYRSREAINRIMNLVLQDGESIVIVDSPPGAGKTALVEILIATAVLYFDLRVVVVTPKAEQLNDLVRRLNRDYQPISIQLLKAREREIPADITNISELNVASSVEQLILNKPSVIVGTAAKLFLSVPQFERKFDILICDEAYQLAYKDFLPLFELANQIILVGDPGQLPPLIQVNVAQFEAAAYRVHWPVPKEMLRRFRDIPIVRLPATRRLPQDTVEIIQPALYPTLHFVSIAGTDYKIKLNAKSTKDAIDNALNKLAIGASMVILLLPATEIPPIGIDEQLTDLIAEIIQRMIDRQIEWRGKRQLTLSDIGCIDAHVASGASIRHKLQQREILAEQVMVDTPEIWQGLERPIMLVKHPLSGQTRLNSFMLEPGRFSVMLSRHQLGCILVARDGIEESLQQHQHDCGRRALGAENSEWQGWRAHSVIWTALKRRKRLIRI